jgi:hypothetical protein
MKRERELVPMEILSWAQKKMKGREKSLGRKQINEKVV